MCELWRKLDPRRVNAGGAMELVTDGVGRAGVDGLRDGSGESVLRRGQAGGVDDEGAVVAPAAGDADVDTGAARTGLDDAKGVVGCGALAAVAGDRPAELDMPSHVAGGKGDAAAVRLGDGEGAVVASGGDGPGVPVAHKRAGIGDQRRVFAGGDAVPD